MMNSAGIDHPSHSATWSRSSCPVCASVRASGPSAQERTPQVAFVRSLAQNESTEDAGLRAARDLCIYAWNVENKSNLEAVEDDIGDWDILLLQEVPPADIWVSCAPPHVDIYVARWSYARASRASWRPVRTR